MLLTKQNAVLKGKATRVGKIPGVTTSMQERILVNI